GATNGGAQRLMPPTSAAGASETRTADVGGVRLTMHAARGARRGQPRAPADTPRTLRRPLAIVAAVALLLPAPRTGLASRAMDNPRVVPQTPHSSRPTLGRGGQTPNPTVGASGHDAELRLGAATTHSPAYASSLASASGSRWTTDGKVAFFG